METEPPKYTNLLVFKFTNDSCDLALTECYHQAKEVLPSPHSPSCRQASWRVRFSEGCSMLMKSKPGKLCDLRILRPSWVVAGLSAAGHSCQATPNRALPCPGWGGGGGPVQAALWLFPFLLSSCFWGTCCQHSQVRTICCSYLWGVFANLCSKKHPCPKWGRYCMIPRIWGT